MENETNVNAELTNEGSENKEAQTYSAEEVAKLVQAEADRRVSQALAKQQKKYEKEISLSQLDEEERAKAEKDMRIAELEEKVREYDILQNKNELSKTLAARGLDTRLVDLIEVGADIGEAQKKVEMLDKMFKEAVQEEVKKRLSTGSPRDTGKSTGELSREDFKKMTLAQQSKLYAENPDLYLSLAGVNK